jgi:hypothetical protein
MAEKIRIRSDSAWYNEIVFESCHDQGIEFAISVPQSIAVRAVIMRIPENEWKSLSRNSEDTREVAESVHMSDKGLRAYRLIALREPRTQMALFEGPYFYHAIITNIDTHSARAILRWHRGRMGSENLLKELKEGFAARHLPCGEFMANAAYFQISILAYNLIQAFKLVLLPQRWQRFTIKTLRFRLLNIAGLVSRNARQLFLALPKHYPFFLLFKRTRWRAVGIAYE